MKLSSMDTKKKAEEGTTLHLKHLKTGKLLYSNSDPLTGDVPLDEKGNPIKDRPITLTGYGADSNKFKNARNELRKKLPEKPINDDFEKLGMDHLCAITTGWTGIDGEDGNELKCTNENLEEMFTRWPWAAEQWLDHLNNRANFLPDAKGI